MENTLDRSYNYSRSGEKLVPGMIHVQTILFGQMMEVNDGPKLVQKMVSLLTNTLKSQRILLGMDGSVALLIGGRGRYAGRCCPVQWKVNH